MHHVTERFTLRPLLAILAIFALAFAFAFLGAGDRPADLTAPLSDVVVEEVLADNSQPAPTFPGGNETYGWTAWSG